MITTELEDEAVAEHLEEQALLGIAPNRCGRIWLHTHPGSSPTPSLTDEATFERCFSGCDWSVMAILAKGGDSYARLQIQTGPGAEVILPVRVDWSEWPTWSQQHGNEVPHLVRHWQHALQTLITEHQQLGQAYRAGRDQFLAANADPAVGDKAVKGNVRTMLELLQSPGFKNRRSYLAGEIEEQVEEARNSWE